MNPLRRLLSPIAALGLVALGGRAAAQTQSYVAKTKTVNAAVLMLEADRPNGNRPYGGLYQYPQTAAPYAFYNLDAARTVKPTGWTFTNPFAPGVVTDEIRARYEEVYGSNLSTNTNLPQVGNRIGKRFAPYWTVRLSDLSETQIANYDVLLIAPKYNFSLTSLERERLRRFVDGGGVLWVDLYATGNGGGADVRNNLPFALQPRTNFTGNPYRDLTSPVLAGPKTVTDADLGFLNPNGFGDLAIEPVGLTDANYLSLGAEYFRYRNVASITSGNTTLPVIAEARLGDGAIVVTARGAALMLNRGSDPNLGLLGDTTNSNVAYRVRDENPQLGAQEAAAARLAVNIASLGGNSRQNGGTHHTSSAVAETGAPVLTRFKAETTTGAITDAPNGTPVTYKGYYVATVGNKVMVFDAIPNRDLDGDGDPDDGIADNSGAVNDAFRDTSVGKPLDLVWASADLGTRLSAPVIAEVPEAGVGRTDQILVTGANGHVYVFPLVKFVNFRAVGGTGLVATIADIQAPGGGTVSAPPIADATPLPPTVYDNLAYVADSTSNGVGRVWVIDLTTGLKLSSTTDWFIGGATTSGNPLPRFTATPTIGYIPAPDSPGGADRVAYVPGIASGSSQPGFVSLWLGAKGETPADVSINAGVLSLTTHAGASSQLPVYVPTGGSSAQKMLAPHLTVLRDGVPVDPTVYGISGPTGPGTNGTLNYTTTLTAVPTGVEFRLDYSIDWGADPAVNTGLIERGRLYLPVNKGAGIASAGDDTKRILGPIALTARGTLHMLEGQEDPTNPDGTIPAVQTGDSYFAVREDLGQRGNFRVVSRFTLYQKYSQTFGGSGVGTNVPAVLGDADGVQGFFPPGLRNNASFNTFTNFRFVGGVAVRNGIAFAPIIANRLGVIPVTMMAAFRAEPETAELRLGSEISGTDPANLTISLQQADFGRSKPGANIQQPNQSTLAGGSIVVDQNAGVVRIENLANAVRGEITDCLSESQPLGYRTGVSASYTYRWPDQEGDRWSPLLWFGLWNGAAATSAPHVAGNEVFLGAQSSLPSLLSGGTPTQSSVVWSVDADAPTSGNYVATLPDRPWIVQQVQIVPGTTVDTSPYYRMPQNRGVTSFSDFVLRLNQTQLGVSKGKVSLGGGDGIVTAWTTPGIDGFSGVYSLSRADFTVCDEGRLLQVDSAGNPVANTFGGRFTGIGNGGGAANERSLVRPVKAYPVGTSETLVVDAGANRIMRLDEDGNVLRSLDRIQVDPAAKPNNYRAGEPLAFKDPRDVVTWEGYVRKADNTLSNPQDLEYWIHYLVADSGNGRLVELVDRFVADKNSGLVGAPVTFGTPDPESGGVFTGTDTNGVTGNLPVAQVGVLVWQSPSLEGTTKLGDTYTSISRNFVGTIGTGRYVFVAGLARTRPTVDATRQDTVNNANQPPTNRPAGGAGGAVVVFDPLGGTKVYDRFDLPDRSAMPVLAIPAGVGADTYPAVPFATDASRGAQASRPFSGLSSTTARTALNAAGDAGVQIMVSDADAVYEFFVPSTALAAAGDANRSFGTPDWMIDETTYTALRPAATDPSTAGQTQVRYTNNARYFRPAFARRLDSGDVLLVNGYRGLMRDNVTAYSGEVSLIEGAFNDPDLGYTLTPTGSRLNNLGFSLSSVHFELPPLTGIRGLVSPVFADRR